MLKLTLKLSLVAILTCFISTTCIAGVSDNSIYRLMEISGVAKQISEFPGLFKTGLEQAKQQHPELPDDFYKDVINALDDTILPSEIHNEIHSTLKNSLSDTDIIQLTRWFESDLGRRIVEAEEKGSTPEALQEIQQNINVLLSDKERVGFAQRIDKLVSVTDMGLKVEEFSSIATYSALMSALRPEQPLNIEAAKSQIALRLAQVRPNMELYTTASMVYSYRNIEIADLKKYEKFINDSQSTQFNKKVIEGMTIGLEKCILKWTNSIATMAKKGT